MSDLDIKPLEAPTNQDVNDLIKFLLQQCEQMTPGPEVFAPGPPCSGFTANEIQELATRILDSRSSRGV